MIILFVSAVTSNHYPATTTTFFSIEKFKILISFHFFFTPLLSTFTLLFTLFCY